MFIHIRPEETRALERIPKGLQFPAPGLPKGHMVLGYDENGACPMLVDEKCSIYEDRPQTCRDYDCRVFAATGIDPSEHAQPISDQIARFRFAFPDERDRNEYAGLKATAAFLVEHREAFPPGTLPTNPAQLALLAIQVHQAVSELGPDAAHAGRLPDEAEIVKAVLAATTAQRTDATGARRGSGRASP